MATRSPAARHRFLLHPPFVAMGGTLLIAAFFTDYNYISSSLFQWANFSAWLITAGLVLALIAAIFLVIDLLVGGAGRIRWIDFAILALAAILSIFNAFVHSRDAWTSVVPDGIVLSAITAVLLLVAAFRGWTRHGEPPARRWRSGMTNRFVLVVVSATALVAACAPQGQDPRRQVGPNPWLPEPRQFLLPPMSVPKAIGWKAGESPRAPAGLEVQALATGLMHPRIVYGLPNGDILVVESNGPGTVPFRPKDYIQGPIKARGGAKAKGGEPHHVIARREWRRRS